MRAELEAKLPQDYRERWLRNAKEQMNIMLGTSKTPAEGVDKIVESTRNTVITHTDDGAEPPESDVAVNTANINTEEPVMQPKTPLYEKKGNVLVLNTAGEQATKAAEQQINQNMQQTNKVYFTKPSEKKPVSLEKIQDTFKDKNPTGFDPKDMYKVVLDKLDSFKATLSTPQAVEASKSTDTDWKDDDLISRKCVYKSQGKVVNYTQKAEKLPANELANCLQDSPARNISSLKKFITNQICDRFGGWHRIRKLVIRDYQIILNDVCYIPVVDVKIDKRKFPIDTLDYINTGALVPLFNWKVLRGMSSLTYIDIDDKDVLATYIAADLGYGRSIGVTSLFHKIPSLDTLVLGGEVLTRDKAYKPESLKSKGKLAIAKRNLDIRDSCNFHILKGLNGLQDYTFNNLKSYATNRGNKPLWRFTAGTVSRSCLFFTAGMANVTAHFTKGIINTVREVWKETKSMNDPTTHYDV